MTKLTLSVLHSNFAVCRLLPESNIPDWATTADQEFIAITRTKEELSIVCDASLVPPPIQTEKTWRALKVEGPLDFSLTGILATLAQPLAVAKISIFAISTYDTDYILVKEENLADAVKVLKRSSIFKIE